jgi:hypothetical protein
LVGTYIPAGNVALIVADILLIILSLGVIGLSINTLRSLRKTASV